MKTSTLLIVAGAAVGVVLLVKAKKTTTVRTTKASTFAQLLNLPTVRFAAVDPNSTVARTNYYLANPGADPWDFLGFGLTK